MISLYASVLGPAWSTLDAGVRRVHGGGCVARGTFAVRRGAGLVARLIAALLRMPPAADATPVTLTVDRAGDVERWRRTFADRPLRTVQWAKAGLLVEGMGLVQCWFRLRAEAGALLFEQVRATIGFRRLALPLPRFLAPRVEGRAEPAAGGVHVAVRIHAPVVGLLVAYEGSVTAEATASAEEAA